MSDSNLLASTETADRPSLAFTKADVDRTSEQYERGSMTIQGVTEDGRPFSKARIPVDDEGRAISSEETFGDDADLARLVVTLLEEEGWEYVEQ